MKSLGMIPRVAMLALFGFLAAQLLTGCAYQGTTLTTEDGAELKTRNLFPLLMKQDESSGAVEYTYTVTGEGDDAVGTWTMKTGASATGTDYASGPNEFASTVVQAAVAGAIASQGIPVGP